MGQKGVDLRIGLDVALLSLRRIVDTIVLATGDSDFIPALKFARREGLRVYLDTMGAPVRPELVEHADFVLNSSLRVPSPAASSGSRTPISESDNSAG
ncbi:MAG: NYN domain-containing protein [Actinomycetota bacterium]